MLRIVRVVRVGDGFFDDDDDDFAWDCCSRRGSILVFGDFCFKFER